MSITEILTWFHPVVLEKTTLLFLEIVYQSHCTFGEFRSHWLIIKLKIWNYTWFGYYFLIKLHHVSVALLTSSSWSGLGLAACSGLDISFDKSSHEDKNTQTTNHDWSTKQLSTCTSTENRATFSTTFPPMTTGTACANKQATGRGGVNWLQR